MKKLLVVGVLLVALGSAAGVFSALNFANAAGERQRAERNLDRAKDQLRQAEALPKGDPRQKELLETASKYAYYADVDSRNYVEVVSTARFLAASAAVAVLGGGVVLLVRRRRRLRAADEAAAA